MTEYTLGDARRVADAHAATLDALASDLGGRLVRPGDADYEDARAVWNGMVDRYPAAVARATGVSDVVRTVTAARDADLGLAIRAGGHSAPGLSVCDGGLVLDCAAMNGVTVDPEAGTAVVAAGAEWGDLDAAAQAHGLATPGGVVSDTGVAGLTLGGGTGYLTRAHGLACDRLTRVDVVTADGERATASETSNPDLFRALRGGGGNFGVAVEFEFDLVRLDHPVATCDTWYRFEDAPALLRRYRRLTASADRETNVSPYVARVPDDPEFPDDAAGDLAVVFLGVYAGDPEAGERALRPYRTLADPIVDRAERMAYVDLQTMLDGDSPAGDRYYWKSIAVDDLTDDVVSTFLDRAGRLPGARDAAVVWPMGGAVADLDADETAFPRRDAGFVLNFEAAWVDPSADEDHVSWARESVEAIRGLGGDGVLPNFAGDEGDDRTARAMFRENYEWLRDVKTRWDPENRFGPSGRLDPR
jgi:FAD/FMN-containing dehydrogenase